MALQRGVLPVGREDERAFPQAVADGVVRHGGVGSVDARCGGGDAVGGVGTEEGCGREWVWDVGDLHV